MLLLSNNSQLKNILRQKSIKPRKMTIIKNGKLMTIPVHSLFTKTVSTLTFDFRKIVAT